MKNSYTLKYSALQGLYFGAYCALMGYGSVYLLGQGFSNSVIGVVFALTSVIGFFTQPLIATYADNHPQIELKNLVSIGIVGAVVLSIVIFFMRGASPILICVFIGIVTCMITVQPLTNTLAFSFEKYGISINFGLGRGIGSVAYAIVSIIVGYIVEAFGIYILPLIYLILNACLVFVVYSMAVPKNAKVIKQTDEEVETKENQLSIIGFAKKYKKFMFLAIGAIFVYFTLTVINNFFIQVIRPIGGTESQMGIAVFIAAILELPSMAYFEKISAKIGCSNILRIAVIMFIVKHAITLLAPNMAFIYVAQVMQMFSFALYQPAVVYYVNKVIDPSDANKGQSMMTMATAASGIIANLAGGILLDLIGVFYVLLIGVIISIIGALITFASLEDVK